MSQQIIIAVLSIIAILLVGSTFLFFYFKSVRSEVEEYWLSVLYKLRDRLDKIPQLIELVRSLPEVNQDLIKELIQMRSACWRMDKPDKQKINAELSISQKLYVLWKLQQIHQQLNKDVDFLALKSEFKAIGQELEKMLESYNQKVRHYNKLRNFLLIRPFMLIFHYSKMLIFEFEP